MAPEQTVLLVEDGQDDALPIRRAFERSGMLGRIRAATDADEAIADPTNAGRCADRRRLPPPDLILVDLHLRRRSGFDLPRRRSEREPTRRIPAVVPTCSRRDEDKDVGRADRLGANSYPMKPESCRPMRGVLQSVGRYRPGCNVRPHGLDRDANGHGRTDADGRADRDDETATAGRPADGRDSFAAAD